MKVKILFALTILLFLAALAPAQRAPMTSNDLPFYARIESGLIHTDGEWAAIPFYRPPQCVRANFNLLNFFDVPAAFGCNAAEPYLEGFGIFKGAPAPIQSKLQLVAGREMPIWFVEWAELEPAVTDNILTIGELAALPSLIEGWATFYTETLHPFGVAQQTMFSAQAFGYLEDDRAFTYHAIEATGELRHIAINFK